MATRRLNVSEKTALEKDERHEREPPAGEKSNITPAVPLYVVHYCCAVASFIYEYKHMYMYAYIIQPLIHNDRHVIVKLLAFTLAMVVCPISSYFLTLNYVFSGMYTLSISSSP